MGATQAGAARAGQAAASTAGAKLEWRNKRPEMRYRKLGRTGFMISEMVCGGDPISPTNNRHVELAIEMGLNYLDTAPEYGEGQSERGYGAIIQGAKRDQVFVNTKISVFPDTRFAAYEMLYARLNRDEQAAILREVSEDIERRRVTVPNYFGNYFNGQIRQVEEAALANAMEKKYGAKIDRPRVYVKTIIDSLEGSLKRLQTDHVDLMMCPHACSSPAEVQIHEIYEAFELLRKQGKVRCLGVSAHNDPAGVLKAAMRDGRLFSRHGGLQHPELALRGAGRRGGLQAGFWRDCHEDRAGYFSAGPLSHPGAGARRAARANDSRRYEFAPEGLPLRAEQSPRFRSDLANGERKAGEGEFAGGEGVASGGCQSDPSGHRLPIVGQFESRD